MQQENENLRGGGGGKNGGGGMLGGTGHGLTRSMSPMAQQGMPQMVCPGGASSHGLFTYLPGAARGEMACSVPVVCWELR